MPDNFYDSAVRQIQVLLWAPPRARKLQTWIRVNDMDWAIRYVHAELVNQGVPLHPENSTKDKAGLLWDSAKSTFVFHWLDQNENMQQVQQAVARVSRKTNTPLEPGAYRALKRDARIALKNKVVDLGQDTASFGAWETDAEDCEGDATSDSQPLDMI